ncbi:MAG: M48 family metallopeptidase [Vicinamibacterales bacterium]
MSNVDRYRFRALIQQLESLAARHPRRYRAQVLALAALGYCYLALVVALAVVGAYGIYQILFHLSAWFAGKLAWVALGLAATVLRACWVRMPEPNGHAVTPTDAPRLFARLEDLRARGQAPRIHRVLVTPDLNAAIVQVARFGVVGRSRNVLLVGLPLLHALALDEFESVLAHECGHLVGHHGRIAGWIYRLRSTWDRLLSTFTERPSLGSLLFVPFFRWYAPFFSAYSFVWARINEYDADKHAASTIGADATARALVRAHLAARLAEERFWRDLRQQGVAAAAPPTDAISRLCAVVRTPLPPADARAWTLEAMRVNTDYDETHPCLAARVRALGLDPAALVGLGSASGPSAVDALMGEAASRLSTTFDAEWSRAEDVSWQLRHQSAIDARARRAELEAVAAPSADELWERVALTVELEGTAAAVPTARRLLEFQPDHARARYFLGCVQLDAQDDAGVTFVEEAVRLDRHLTLLGYDVLFNYFWRQGDVIKAERYRTLRDGHLDVLEQAESERRELNGRARCLPHGLPASVLRSVRAALERCEHLHEAYLVRRDVRTCPEWPCYVLAVAPKRRIIESQLARDRDVLQQALASSDWPQGTYVFVWTDLPRGVRRLISDVPNARIY